MKQKMMVIAIAVFLTAIATFGAMTSTDAYGSGSDDGKCYGQGKGHDHHDKDGDGVDDKKGNGHHKERCGDDDE